MVYLKELLSVANHYVKLIKSAEAGVRSRGHCVFPAEHPKVNDNKDHFPINSEDQARNALSRANQYSAAPEWFNGSLSSLLNSVVRAVKGKYPSVEVTEKSRHPGKD